MTKAYVIILLMFFVSCLRPNSNQQNKIPKTYSLKSQNINVTEDINFTFLSQDEFIATMKELKKKVECSPYHLSNLKVIDFTVSSATGIVIYNGNEIIDTAMNDKLFTILNCKEIIYQKIKKNQHPDYISNDTNNISADVEKLRIYDGNYEILDLPLIDNYFSNPAFINSSIIYWGFGDLDSLFACKYNLKDKSFEKVYLTSESIATDFFGYFTPPRLKDSAFIFLLNNEKQKWTINQSFKNLK